MTINQTILLLKIKLNDGRNGLERPNDKTDLNYLIIHNLVTFDTLMIVPIVSAKGEVLCSCINNIVNLSVL